ncbi:hypothetical protein Tco_1376292 [Tanacetum coccineum]
MAGKINAALFPVYLEDSLVEVEEEQFSNSSKMLTSVILLGFYDRWDLVSRFHRLNSRLISLRIFHRDHLLLAVRCYPIDGFRCAGESCSHLFFSCSMAQNITTKLARWWEFDCPDLFSYDDWLEWFHTLRLLKGFKDILEGVFYVMWWVIWKYRNQTLFGSSQPRMDMLFDEIKTIVDKLRPKVVEEDDEEFLDFEIVFHDHHHASLINSNGNADQLEVQASVIEELIPIARVPVFLGIPFGIIPPYDVIYVCSHFSGVRSELLVFRFGKSKQLFRTTARTHNGSIRSLLSARRPLRLLIPGLIPNIDIIVTSVIPKQRDAFMLSSSDRVKPELGHCTNSSSIISIGKRFLPFLPSQT